MMNRNNLNIVIFSYSLFIFIGYFNNLKLNQLVIHISLSMGLIIISLLKRRKKIGILPFIFMSIFSVCNLGRVFSNKILKFNLLYPNKLDALLLYNDFQIENGIYFFWITSLFIYLGILFGEKYKIMAKKKVRKKINKKQVLKIGKLIFLITFFPALILLIMKFNVKINNVNEGFIFSAMGILGESFFTSLVIIILYSKNKKYFFLGLIYYLILFTLGGRGKPILSILILFFCMYGEKLNLNKIGIKLLIVLYLFIKLVSNFLLTIRYVRGKTLEIALKNFCSVYFNLLKEKSPIIEIIHELGVAIVPLLSVINLVPKYISVRYGKSMFCSIFYLIPGLIKYLPNNISKEMLISRKVSSIMELSFGYNFLCDFYINFHVFSCILGLFLGYFIVRVSKRILLFDSKMSDNWVLDIFAFQCIYPILWFSRSSVSFFIAYLGNSMLLLIILKYFLIKIKK